MRKVIEAGKEAGKKRGVCRGNSQGAVTLLLMA